MPKIQMRRDTAANWKTVNPTLLAGEWALETDTKKMKIGDGDTTYNELMYFREADNRWQKPADWVDIRSGALPNAIYFLVGHSADYATYPKFAINASVSTSANTYDVFVDGVKQAATASGSATTLDWQTLALASGFNTTYPVALRTHIIRVTPTVSTDSITKIQLAEITGQLEQGLLWAHFNINNAVNLDYAFNSGNKEALLLESVTSGTGEIMVDSQMRYAFRRCASLKNLPTLNSNNTVLDAYRAFLSATSLKKISLKNAVLSGQGVFDSCSILEKITVENAFIRPASNTFNGCTNLKELPTVDFGNASANCASFMSNLKSLKDTFIDASGGSNITRLTVNSNSSNFAAGIKGLTVSDEAPFTGTSPQINVSYTGMDRAVIINLFNSLPTVSVSQVCNVTGCTGATDLTPEDLAIATAKGWTVTR